MQRTSTRASGDRIAMGLARAVIDKINDDPFLQTLGIKIRGAEGATDVEHAHPFGFTAFPMGKTTDAQAQSGMMKGAAEVFLQTLTGNMSHPVAMPAIDRRFRPNGMKAGEAANHDAYKQFIHFREDGTVQESPKKLTIRAAKDKEGSGSGSGGSGSGSSGGQQKRENSGAKLRGEKTVKVQIELDFEGGTLAMTAAGAATMTFESLTLKAGGCTMTMKDGKIILDGDVYVGGESGAKKIAFEDTRDSLGGKLQAPFASKAKAV